LPLPAKTRKKSSVYKIWVWDKQGRTVHATLTISRIGGQKSRRILYNGRDDWDAKMLTAIEKDRNSWRKTSTTGTADLADQASIKMLLAGRRMNPGCVINLQCPKR
jgi:hypothetical protein